jgi:hypothetical protein|tara:strand:+ start:1891 stop:2094 length:204 start_codon:yes stop_codon:yes gene_type:complete
MADIKTIALPLPNIEYDSNNEALTRRSIEIAIEDLNAKIVTIQKMQSTITSKASKRHQFLLMGMKHV